MSLKASYPNQIIYDNEADEKVKKSILGTLILEAYKYNPHFRGYSKTYIKNNLNYLLKEMESKYTGENSEEIIIIISSMRLWSRKTLPLYFDIHMNMGELAQDFDKRRNLIYGLEIKGILFEGQNQDTQQHKSCLFDPSTSTSNEPFWLLSDSKMIKSDLEGCIFDDEEFNEIFSSTFSRIDTDDDTNNSEDSNDDTSIST